MNRPENIDLEVTNRLGTANRRRFAVVALVSVLPWVIVTWGGGWYPLFAVGFARGSSVLFTPSTFTTLPEYLARVGTVPNSLDSWPLATLLYAIALGASAFEKVDGLVVAGFLLLAAFNVGLLGLSLSKQRGVLALPLGVVWISLVAVWVVYADRFSG